MNLAFNNHKVASRPQAANTRSISGARVNLHLLKSVL